MIYNRNSRSTGLTIIKDFSPKEKKYILSIEMLTLTVRIITNKINIIQLTNFPSEGKIEAKAKAEDIEKRNGPI